MNHTPSEPTPKKPEPEHRGSLWSHPYTLYIVISAVLFIFVLVMGWLAWNQGWLPRRGA